MAHQDKIYRFLFEALDIRGELIYLNKSWQEIHKRYSYPPHVSKQLGEALAATAILSATLKFKGSMIMQIQSSGPLQTLVAQSTHEGKLRGLAKWEGNVPATGLADIYGKGQLAMSILQPNREPHQSIVALEGEQLADALEHFFANSEQLKSRFWLDVSEDQVAGLFLQTLPGQERLTHHEEDWFRISSLADTIRPEELQTLNPENLLHRLFHEEQVRLYSPRDVSFECSCSREKTDTSLMTMGRKILLEILEEEGEITVDCDFCRKRYTYNQQQVEALIMVPDDQETGKTLH